MVPKHPRLLSKGKIDHAKFLAKKTPKGTYSHFVYVLGTSIIEKYHA